MLSLIKHAKQLGARPRVHGNGFVQLDLSPHVRLHVWGPEIPRQKVNTPIHNHRFGFTSLVIKGEITNQTYWAQLSDHGAHRIYIAKMATDQNTVLEPTKQRATILPRGTQVVMMGEFYTMAEGEIHESIVRDLTVTVILKTGPSLAQGGPVPTVYVPVDVTPDNSFDRHAFHEGDLWKIIMEALKS